MKECEELKKLNINLKQRIQQTAVVFSQKNDDIVKLSEKVQWLKTQSHDNSAFEQKAIEILKYALLKEDSEADIKMYTLATHDQDFEFLWDENVKCPDCKNEFAYIANIRKHYKKHNFKCHMCGNCLKERESINHKCGLEHVFKRTPLEERSPNWTGP